MFAAPGLNAIYKFTRSWGLLKNNFTALALGFRLDLCDPIVQRQPEDEMPKWRAELHHKIPVPEYWHRDYEEGKLTFEKLAVYDSSLLSP